MGNRVIGIDLGTTNSCVSIVQHGNPTIIVNSQGGRTTPSVVGFSKNGERLVGQIARRQAVVNPKNTIYSIKRLIGTKFDVSLRDKQKLSYQVVSGDKGQSSVHIDVDNKNYTPQQISAMILKKMKQTAQAHLGQTVQKAIITVPAYFNDDQRTATKDAGRIAGLQVLRIINQPTAAALAYGTQSKGNKKIAVYDFGGGTFDISILDIFDGVIQVLSTNGDTHLGGDDIDQILMKYIVDQFKKSQGMDISKDSMAMQRIRQAAQKAKIQLSGSTTANVNLPFITADATGPKHLDVTITLAKFQSMIQEIIKRTVQTCKIAMQDSKLKVSEIDQVILVGGSTRIPMVQKMVKQFFGKQPNKSVNPDQAVAIGAAIQGAILGGDESLKDLLLLDVTPLSLGIQTLGGVFTKLIDKNTTVPVKKSQVFSTAADNQTVVSIHILQGERPMANDNKSLGKFDLVGIVPAPKGVPQIQVTFDIDANGMIHVQAKDMGTGKSQNIKIERAGQLSQEDIQKMIKDSQLHAKQDQERKKIIQSKNKLQGLIYSAQSTIKQYQDKVPQDLIKNLKQLLQKTKNSPQNTLQEIQALYNSLQSNLQQIGKQIYSKTQQNTDSSKQAQN